MKDNTRGLKNTILIERFRYILALIITELNIEMKQHTHIDMAAILLKKVEVLLSSAEGHFRACTSYTVTVILFYMFSF